MCIFPKNRNVGLLHVNNVGMFGTGTDIGLRLSFQRIFYSFISMRQDRVGTSLILYPDYSIPKLLVGYLGYICFLIVCQTLTHQALCGPHR